MISELVRKKTAVQFIKFCAIGCSNTIVHLAVYYLLIGAGAYYLAANFIAFALSVLNSYYWNKKYTFTAGKTTKSTIMRLYASYGATTLLGTGQLFILVDVIGLDKYISPLINIAILTIVNFILNKFYVFKDGLGQRSVNISKTAEN